MKRVRLAGATQSAAVLNSRSFPPFRAAVSHFIFIAKKILPGLFLLSCVQTQAMQRSEQTNDTAYQRVIAVRVAKIVNTVGISDNAKKTKVQELMEQQYFQLNTIHDNSKASVAAIKAKQLSNEETREAVQKEGELKSVQLSALHSRFIGQLKKDLSSEQLEKVKDGMTYRVLPITWTAYLDMLQHLTQEQKDKMYAWLEEARELAMDEGSSDAKHAVFGKYKGKINNYLSAAGYDMKKEGEEWAKRIQAEKQAKQLKN